MSAQTPTHPVTLRDVAAAAGVNPSTVSRALWNDPRLRPATRSRLQALARELGYRPNPFVSAFTAQVRTHRRAPQHAAIAVLDTFGDTDDPQQKWLVVYLRGARRRATDNGFNVEILKPQGAVQSLHDLSQVIRARGLHAVLVLPVTGQPSFSDFDFTHLACATIDYSLQHPPLHRASPDYFQGMHLALDSLRAHRRHRIGFCTYRGEVRRIGAHWMGAFLNWQQACPPEERVAPCVVSLDHNGAPLASREADRGWAACQAEFGGWLKQERPDAVVSNDLFFLDWLRKLGRRVPQDVAFASLGLTVEQRDLAGIDQMSERVGAAATDLIIEQIHRNEFGIPLTPKTVLVPGVWVDGATVA